MERLIRIDRHEVVHEAEEFNAAPARLVGCCDLAGGDLEGRKERRGAIALVVMAPAGQRSATGQLQVTLGALQRLDRGLLINANDNRVLGRRHIEADHVRGLGHERWIIALAPGFAPGEIDLVLPQHAPDVLLMHIAEVLGDQRCSPAGITFGHRLVQHREDAPVSLRRIDLGLPRPLAVLEPFQAFICKAVPPRADDRLFDPNHPRNRPRARPFRRQQYDPRPPYITLRRCRRAASGFKHRALLRPQPDLSRLEKSFIVLNHDCSFFG